MDNTKRLPGRARSAERPIHPSWTDYVAHFDPTNPTRSQNAFCAWAGVRPSSLSAAKRKPITDRIELKLSEWIEEIAIREAETKVWDNSDQIIAKFYGHEQQ